MSQWLFTNDMDDCMSKAKTMEGHLCVRLRVRNIEQSVVAGLHTEISLSRIQTCDP